MTIINTTGINSLQSLAYYTNNQVGGLLITGGIISLYIIALIILLKNDEPFLNVLAIASWVFFLISAFFWISELLDVSIMLMFLFISAFSTLILYTTKSPY